MLRAHKHVASHEFVAREAGTFRNSITCRCHMLDYGVRSGRPGWTGKYRRCASQRWASVCDKPLLARRLGRRKLTTVRYTRAGTWKYRGASRNGASFGTRLMCGVSHRNSVVLDEPAAWAHRQILSKNTHLTVRRMTVIIEFGTASKETKGTIGGTLEWFMSPVLKEPH